MLTFIIISVAVAIVTAHSPEEWKEILNNVEE
jgi:hypothetical protein